MTRKTKKLSLKRDTIRQLDGLELARAAGGGPPKVALDTEAATCPLTHLGATATCLGC